MLFGPADALEEPIWEIPRSDARLRLAYFGAVGTWQIDALRSLAERLELVGADLDIYSSAETIPHLAGVNYRDRLPPVQIHSVMRNYDAAIIPARFDDRLRHLSVFNIATTMSECLASGTVTIVVAPPYAGMVRFLEGARAAIILCDTSEDGVVEAIARLRRADDRRAILSSARQLVEANLSTAAMRESWEQGAGAVFSELPYTTR